MMPITKELPDHAVYTDVVNRGLILPKKQKYTIRDFNKLCKQGWKAIDARWICICSAIYYDVLCSKEFESSKFIDMCKIKSYIKRVDK